MKARGRSAAARPTRPSWSSGSRASASGSESTSWCCSTSTPSGARSSAASRGGCSTAQGYAGRADASPASSTARSTAPTSCCSRCASAARPRGCATRRSRSPCGCIGQETTGAGGFAKALRTVPVVLDIAERGRASCAAAGRLDRRLHQPGRHRHPRAARRRPPRRRALQRRDRLPARASRGCSASSPSGVARRPGGPQPPHLGARRVPRRRSDVLPTLLADARRRARRGGRAAARSCSELGAVPSYYLRYFYAHDEVLARAARRARRARAGGRARSSASCSSSTATRR